MLNIRGLGDSKPSELMDNMLSLLGQHHPCFLFRQIFLQQMPEHVRTPLAVSDTSDYCALALEADKLFLASRTSKSHTSLDIPAQCNEMGSHLMLPAGTTKNTATRPRNAYPLAQNSNVGGTRETPASAGPRDPQLFIIDVNTGRRFLVDTVSVIPPMVFDRRHGQSGSPLQAANGTSIRLKRCLIAFQ